MRRLSELDRYRDLAWERRHLGQVAVGYDKGGCFLLESETRSGVQLHIIAGNGMGWDHVSVSTSLEETPTWAEMEQVKRLFFRDHEVAMQLHVPVSEHISYHPWTLHIWRPHFKKLPTPPGFMVGPASQNC
ncbi:MAG TPA: hypothetical protein VFW22_16330 [Pseudolabrys sp.]|nr:hypothetical protein [Pseudolabrys sp.]